MPCIAAVRGMYIHVNLDLSFAHLYSCQQSFEIPRDIDMCSFHLRLYIRLR